MWLVVGLGNPGDVYSDTRHNIGFMVVEALSAAWDIPLRSRARNYIYGRGFIRGQDVLLIKPLTFMNRSGAAVRDAINKFEDIDKFLVVHDDIDLDTGVIRIRKSGSSGGHKGLESIIQTLGTRDFFRLKLGVGRSDRITVEEYVLGNFTRRERPLIKEAVEKAVDAVHAILTKGISYAQNTFHK
ncbi:MAG: aminoacyl-tRNA hydrolase [Nitrospirae bacterium]|nr:aminoacyl-tRNA hydrolase [Nitrospirota bacterium]